MKPSQRKESYLLTVNGGSSSIKFAVFVTQPRLERKLSGSIDRIGIKNSSLIISDENKKPILTRSVKCRHHSEAAELLIEALESRIEFSQIRSVGHRVVYGMNHTQPEIVTPTLLRQLHRFFPYDPDHLPREIQLMKVFRRRHPQLIQVACFDTAFHQAMPSVARILPIPRRYFRRGVQRYGFHGLSYSFLMRRLSQIDAREARGRIILLHLGNGASLAAVHHGTSVDTSMGFTPTAGIPMGTRSGDLDPGVAWYLMKTDKFSPKRFNDLINHESGLLGVSETSSDMRDLQRRKLRDIRARDAVNLFCYQTKKWIGAFSAALGGLDTLVFSGGIGENSPNIRRQICEGLEYLGIQLDANQNSKNGEIISKRGSPVNVRVIPTDEEFEMARLVCDTIPH